MSRGSHLHEPWAFPKRDQRAREGSKPAHRRLGLAGGERLESRTVLAASFAYDSFLPIEAMAGAQIDSIDVADYHPGGAVPGLDAVVTGTSYQFFGDDPTPAAFPFTKIFRNDGSGVFTDIGADLIGLSSAAAKWADYDGDSRLDVLLTGFDPQSGAAVAKVYRQTATDIFEPLLLDPLEGTSSGTAAWGDYDSDGLMDVIVTGIDGEGRFVAVPFLGDADGSLTQQPQVVLEGISSGSVAWADYDNDGHIDLAVAGAGFYDGGSTPASAPLRMYRNVGDGTFEQVGFEYVSGAMSWADYDNDNRLDLFVSQHQGEFGGGEEAPYLFRSLSDGTFAEVSLGIRDSLFQAVGSVQAWTLADIDADGRVDGLGVTASGGGLHIVRNVTAFAVPDGVFAAPGDGHIKLYWNPPATGGGTAISDYLIQYSHDFGDTWTTVSRGVSTATSVVVSDLVNDMEYQFRVAAVRSGVPDPFCTPISMRPFGVSAEDDFITSVADGEVTITGYQGAGGEVNIPATIDGLPVTAIGDGAFSFGFFSGNPESPYISITSVVIPAGVTTIGARAFAGQWSFASVSLPDSLRSIGSSAFSTYGGRLAGIALPASLETVNTQMFDEVYSLQSVWVDPANPFMQSVDGIVYDKAMHSVLFCPRGQVGRVTLPASVTTVAEGAFSGCFQVSSVILPVGLTTIEEFGFHGAGLRVVDIPATVTSIGTKAFYVMEGLLAITVAEENPAYTSIDGVLYDKSIRTLIQAPPMGAVGFFSVPATVTRLGAGAFSSCNNLAGVTLPFGLMSIDDDAFTGVYFLSTGLVLPPTVTSLGDSSLPSYLEEIVLPSSVVSVGHAALGNGYTYDDYQNFTYSSIMFQGDAPSFAGDLLWSSDPAGPAVFYRSDTSGWSDQVAGRPGTPITLPLATAPGAPTGVSGGEQVVLSWTAPASDGGSAISDYLVQFREAAGPADEWATVIRAASAVASVTISGLTDGTAYVFRVAAVNADGVGTFSPASSMITPSGDIVAPGAPTAVTGTADNGQVALSWTAPASDGGAEIVDYIIEYSSNSGSSWTIFGDGTSASTSATVTGLANGTGYVFRVSAVNAVGAGEVSIASAVVTPRTVADAPTNVSGVAGNRQVSLTWTAPASNGGAAITNYVVQYSGNGGGSWATFSRPVSTATSATVTGLVNGTSYLFRVSAVNAAGTGPASTNSAAVTPRTVAGAPAAAVAVAGDGQVSLTWGAPASNGGAAITDYVIQQSANKGASWTTFSDGTSGDRVATVTGLTNGVSYQFRVQAVNEAGSGAWSKSSVAVMAGATAPTETIDTQGGKLLQKNPAGQLFVDGLPLKRSGVQVREAAFPSVEFLQAEAIGGVNRILFQERASGDYKVWAFDATWTRNVAVQGIPSIVRATSDALAFEAGFNLDFSNDGRIGSLIVESNGTHVLELHSTGLVVDGKSIMRGGRQVTPAGYPAVDFIAAETLDGDNRLLFRDKSTGASKTWRFDTNWVYAGVNDAPVATDPLFRPYEIAFSADINNDGRISVETVGVQTLQRDASGKLFVDGTAVFRGGNQVGVANYTAVDFLGAETVGGTNRLLFREKSTGTYKTWRFDSSWVYQGVDTIPADAPSRNALEAAFGVDLDLDGDIGL